MVIRNGSAVVRSEFGQRPANMGDAVLIGPSIECDSEPEGQVTATTLYLDTGYLIDQLFWQYAGLLRDRLEAFDFASTLCVEHAQLLQIGESNYQLLVPPLDELVKLSNAGETPEKFHRTQADWSSIAHILAPFIRTSANRRAPTARATPRPPFRREYPFAPVRHEAQTVATLLRKHPQRRWAVADLAETVHLSQSQLRRVFTAAYGKSPITYLTMLRAEQMARLLRVTDAPLPLIAHKVGWQDADFAARQFRQFLGVSPRTYRTMTRRPIDSTIE